uniref:Uncharacterized protein n=1 Tax=Arundo donax TaxID=35708 RepID=A0A0A8YBR0_ARUDO
MILPRPTLQTLAPVDPSPLHSASRGGRWRWRPAVVSGPMAGEGGSTAGAARSMVRPTTSKSSSSPVSLQFQFGLMINATAAL